MKKKTLVQQMKLDDIKCWFDGACLGSYPPDKIGMAAVVVDNEKKEEKEYLTSFSSTSKQVDSFLAEHMAALILFRCLEKTLAEENCNRDIRVYGDNKIVIDQLNNIANYKKAKVYSKYFNETRSILSRIKKTHTLNISWVSRNQNKRADKLSKEALLIDKGTRVIYEINNN